jgi:hypothetical protein
MRSPRRLRGALPVLLLGALIARSAPAAEECAAPPPAAVSLLILANAQKVQAFAQTVQGATAVARDASTVVFDDGRVVTADVESAGRHLNALGWAARPIHVVNSLPKRASQPRRSFG